MSKSDNGFCVSAHINPMCRIQFPIKDGVWSFETAHSSIGELKTALEDAHEFMFNLERELEDFDRWHSSFEITAPTIAIKFQGKDSSGAERSAFFSRLKVQDFLKVLRDAEEEPCKP